MRLANTYGKQIESSTKSYGEMLTEYGNMRSAFNRTLNATDGRILGIADVNIVRAMARLTDIRSTVREGEQAIYASAQGLLNKWKAKVEGGWQNGAVLTPEARREFLALAGQLEKEAKKQTIDKIAPTYRRAMRSGLVTEDEILPDYLLGQIPATGKSATSEPPTGGSQRKGTNGNPFAPKEEF